VLFVTVSYVVISLFELTRYIAFEKVLLFFIFNFLVWKIIDFTFFRK